MSYLLDAIIIHSSCQNKTAFYLARFTVRYSWPQVYPDPRKRFTKIQGICMPLFFSFSLTIVGVETTITRCRSSSLHRVGVSSSTDLSETRTSWWVEFSALLKGRPRTITSTPLIRLKIFWEVSTTDTSSRYLDYMSISNINYFMVI